MFQRTPLKPTQGCKSRWLGGPCGKRCLRKNKRIIWEHYSSCLGFPCGSAGKKKSACNVGDLGSILGLGISPEEEKGYPLQYSSLENSIGLYSPWVYKESDMTEWLSLHFTALA